MDGLGSMTSSPANPLMDKPPCSLQSTQQLYRPYKTLSRLYKIHETKLMQSNHIQPPGIGFGLLLSCCMRSSSRHQYPAGFVNVTQTLCIVLVPRTATSEHTKKECWSPPPRRVGVDRKSWTTSIEYLSFRPAEVNSPALLHQCDRACDPQAKPPLQTAVCSACGSRTDS